MDSSVKVGVRIRPPLASEASQGLSISDRDIRDNAIAYKSSTFTFDNVFSSSMSQQNLYEQTAYPMLKSFLEGFNVTIIAYGQTGSGVMIHND